MDIDTHRLLELIRTGEGLDLEFKSCRNRINSDIYVPESSQVHRCNGRIYDRNEDGDLDITDHTAQVAQLYQRKQATYSENKVFPYIQIEHLRRDLIEKCRRYVRINADNHPWADMDDQQLLKSAQLYQTDPLTKESGVTLGGVMLFAPDQLILQVCPAHRTDLILRKVNVDRYDDRDLVRTNLIDSYDRILAFIKKHLPDPFYLEGIERRSLRDAIFREVASNMLIHREYASGVPARLIIEFGKVTTYNANSPHGFGVLNPETFAPFPKNPVIGAFFREIERADELGSGMRKMMLYGKKYGGTDPQLIEGDVFRMLISVPEFGDNPAAIPRAGQVGVHEGVHEGAHEGAHEAQLTGTMKRILDVLVESKSTPQLLALLGYPRRTRNYEAAIRQLLESGLIEMTLPDKPRSKNQQYRLTNEGRTLLESQNKKTGQLP